MSATPARIKPLQTASREPASPSPAAYAGPTIDTGRLVAAAERHQRQIWGGIGLIFVALMVAGGIYANNQRKLAADNVALAHAFALLDSHIDEEQPAKKSPAARSDETSPDEADAEQAEREAQDSDGPLVGQPHFATTRERNVAAHAAFAAAIPHLSSRSLRTLAEMMAGNLEVELGQSAEARGRFEALIDRLPAEETLGALARMRLAYVLESEDARQKALEVLTPLTDEQRSHFADEAGLMRARLLAAEGEVQLARMTLEQVRSRSTNQALAEEARIALAALNDQGQMPAQEGLDAGPAAAAPSDAPAAAEAQKP